MGAGMHGIPAPIAIMNLVRWVPFFAVLALAGCGPVPDGTGPQPTPLASAAGSWRAMSYNIEWLTSDTTPERRERLKKVLDEVQPSLLMLQEIESRRSLEGILGPEWTVAMLDAPGEDQEIAVAVRAPLKLVRWSMLYRGREHDDAFPNDRDLLRAEVAAPGGATLAVYSVHWKSRAGEGRRGTDARRAEAARLTALQVRKEKTPYVLIGGDFNDTPNDVSVNTLEREGGGMVNLMESLYYKDYVTADLEKWRRADELDRPRVPGASQENEKFRGKEYNFSRDVKIKPILLDQLIASKGLADRVKGDAVIYWSSDILDGEGPVLQGGSVSSQGTRASDHLPVYATFQLP